METRSETLLRTHMKVIEGGGGRSGKEGEVLRQCWDMINGIWKLCSAEKLLHILALFTLPSPTSLSLNLVFPWHAFYLSRACFFFVFFFFVHATLKFSGTRTQGCYLSATVSHPLFIFFLPCSEVLNLCFKLTSNHSILILPIMAVVCQAPCLHGGP